MHYIYGTFLLLIKYYCNHLLENNKTLFFIEDVECFSHLEDESSRTNFADCISICHTKTFVSIVTSKSNENVRKIKK